MLGGDRCGEGLKREPFHHIEKSEIGGTFANGKTGRLTVPRVDVIAAPVLKLFSKTRSRAGGENADINYELKVMNCSKCEFISDPSASLNSHIRF